ncbi:hypothetical protein ACHAWF_006070 [Thalassiosira exigua]
MKGRDYNALIKQKSARKKQEDAAVPTRSLTKVVTSSSSPSHSKRQLGNGYTEKIKAKQQEKKEAEAALAAAESAKKRRASKEGSGGSPKNGKPAVPRGSSLVFDDDETWNENYEALKKFQEEHGNCDVPFGKDTGALRSWTERQKKLYAHEKLDEERMGKMTYLGFQF